MARAHAVQDTAFVWPVAAPAGPPVFNGTWIYPTRINSNLYPEKASHDHVQGQAVIDCYVKQSGHISQCSVRRESPAGYGFGKASVDAFVRYAHVDPSTIPAGAWAGSKAFALNWTF